MSITKEIAMVLEEHCKSNSNGIEMSITKEITMIIDEHYKRNNNGIG